MDDLRTRIAAVVAAHRDQCGDCSCGWESWEESWDMHLADALIRELATTYVSREAIMTEIQSYATDHENLGLAESAQDLIDTAAEWEGRRMRLFSVSRERRAKMMDGLAVALLLALCAVLGVATLLMVK